MDSTNKNQKRSQRIDLRQDLVDLIDTKFRLKFGDVALPGKYAKKIKMLLDLIPNEETTSQQPDQDKQNTETKTNPPEETSHQHNHHRKNCYKPIDQLSQYYLKKKLEKIFEEVDGDLGRYYSTNLANLLTLMSQHDPKQAEQLVQSIDEGKLVQRLLQKEIQPAERIVSPSRALLSKDEGLISDEIFRAFVIECGVSSLFPSLDAVKKRRKELNEEITERLIIERMHLPDGNIGYECNVMRVIKLILQAVETFTPKQQIPDRLEFKISLDGRLMHGKKDILVGLIPLNLGFVTQNEYNVWPLAIFSGKEDYNFLNVSS